MPKLNAPLEQRTDAANSMPRGIIKAESVRLGFTYTILRLPIVYGPGYRPAGMFEFFREQLPKKTLGSRLPGREGYPSWRLRT